MKSQLTMMNNLFLKKKIQAVSRIFGFEAHYAAENPNREVNTRTNTHHSCCFFIYCRDEAEEKKRILRQITDEKGVQAGKNALETITKFIHNPEDGWEEDVVIPMNEYFESKGNPIPAQLRTQKAKELLDRLVIHNYLDTNYQPFHLSRPKQAFVASKMSNILGIRNLWKVFGELWGVSSSLLRNYYNKGLQQKEMLAFQDSIKNILH